MSMSMSMSFGALTFTPAVQALQERYGSRRQYAAMESRGAGRQGLGDDETAFIADRDSFYWATIGSTGWPYIQHRGGPTGFLKVIDQRTLALSDFRGNKQYISVGNLKTDDRVAMILVDYPRQARLKLLGTVETLEGDAAAPWTERVGLPGYKAVVERVFIIHVEAFDWNCPQHITSRYTSAEIRTAVEPLETRLQQLEEENRLLRQQVAASSLA